MEVFNMLYKQKILAFTMLFVILASNSFVVLGVSTLNSGENSGDGSTVLPPVGPTISGESSGENVLKSAAKSSSISTKKNTSILCVLK